MAKSAKTGSEGHVPPAPVSKQAEKGLELRKQFGRGGTQVGVARARDLKDRKAIPDDTIKRMVSYFARHEVDKRGKNWADEAKPSAGYIAWLLWGGDEGRDWCEKIKADIEAARSRG